jgi:hypothetical protein
MSQFVESLKRLYQAGSVDSVKVDALYKAKKLTQEEVDYIKG